MSNRWPGGIIRKTPVTPAGPYQNGAASGVWSLADAAYWTKQGLWPIAGNVPLAVEDVFSTWLYTGNGSTQTITNGINLSGEGGLVWTKLRSGSSTYWHSLADTNRGAGNIISTNETIAQFSQPLNITGFTTTGFTVGDSFSNTSGYTFASWTFRQAPKFFDVVTWTGNGTNQFINHNLGVTPGFVIYKATSTTSDWFTLARGSDGNYSGLRLNLTNQADIAGLSASSAGLTATTFNPNAIYGNTNGVQYVAYLYAHDTASTGLIQCGSYTGNGSATGPIIDLGWEPQWVMIKNTTSAANWVMYDTMRGFTNGGVDATLFPNLSSEEDGTNTALLRPLATGFQLTSTSTSRNASGATYIYMAIRRGPMKTPTLGTSVFLPSLGSSSGQLTVTTNFPSDLAWFKSRGGSQSYDYDRLRGNQVLLITTNDAESTGNAVWDSNTTFRTGDTGNFSNWAFWNFRRAPGFFDEVCYTGTGANLTLNHNLGAAPELIIIKRRNSTGNWPAITQFTATTSSSGWLKESDGFFRNLAYGAIGWIGSQPTATTFSILTDPAVNTSGGTYVSYLFASAPGVSKVGSYTGNGSSQTINCAFTTGARFVLIKRTDTTGDWYVWDSTRGIVAGNDPYLALNTTAAEVTSNDSVDTDNTGFVVNQVAASNVNVNGATYIFLAIA